MRRPRLRPLRIAVTSTVITSVVLATSLAGSVAPDAEGATASAITGSATTGGVAFLDERAGFIDLDAATRAWSVGVVNTAGQAAHVRLRVVGLEGGLAVRAPAQLIVPAGGRARFVVARLPDAVSSAGELVLTTDDGGLLRRPVQLVHGEANAVAPSELHFAGVRLAPFGGPVWMSSVDGSIYLDGRADATVGAVESSTGHQGLVTRQDSILHVTGIHRVGTYNGTVDLGGGDATKVTVNVRDSPLWAVLALALGLLLVSRLDDFSNRTQPRRMLELRLIRLRGVVEARARDAQRALTAAIGAEAAGGPRLSAPKGSPPLVIDRIVAGALQSFDDADADGRAAWGSSGSAWGAVATQLHGAERALDRVSTLASRFENAEQAAGGLGSLHQADLDHVRTALRVGDVASEPQLEEWISSVAAAETELTAFSSLLDELSSAATAFPNLDDHIHALTERLLAGAAVATIQAELVRATADAAKEATAAEGRVVAQRPRATETLVGAFRPMPPPPPPSGTPGQRLHSRRTPWRWILVAVLLVVFATFVARPLAEVDRAGRPTPSTLPPPTSVPATLPPPAIPTAMPRPGPAGARASVDAGSVFGYAFFAPLTLGLALLTALALVLNWVVGRDGQTQDLDALDRHMRRQDRRFAVLSGALVLLSGLSVVYFPNPSFGTMGDYVTALLWATGTAAGLTLARRFAPVG